MKICYTFFAASASLVIGGAAHGVVIEEHGDGFDAHMARVARKGWVLSSTKPAPSELMHLVVAVKQDSIDALATAALAVSDPTNAALYGKHLSNDAVHALVAPRPASLEAVRGWLTDVGVEPEHLTPNADFIGATVNLTTAEALLQTTYGAFVHTATGERALRVSAPYALPRNVARAVDFVAPTMSFATPKTKSARLLAAAAAREPLGANGLTRIGPAYLRKIYGMSDTDVGKGAASNNTMAVASFIKQFYKASDTTAFMKKYPPPSGVDTPFEDVPTTQKHSPVGTEAALDTQFLAGLGAGISAQAWYTDGTQPGNVANEPFVAWLTTVAATADDKVPALFSISYGDEENGVSKAYALRCNIEFSKAAARGISLLAAAGDAGAGCTTGGYVPTFPASSPWITAVGGLQGAVPESVWGPGGGGFSNYFARPQYQAAAATAYFAQSGLPAQRMWNRSGAGFPDIAAHAVNFDVCTDNFFYPVAGTSAASPTAAGIFAMLNQVRVDAGKPKLGFLNPFIYQNGGVFNDITKGKNDYCDNPEAFPATKGWDAASGMGSPNFAALKTKVLALP